ncbi:hypothetical protein O181_130452 [Austropuccinia psidii MF-1]|uniref:Secreted protein n=1 Tax=Austropuccinia psidii MF-1 TaxID=1389203 RepID=A0A9Q3QCH9_9BASI|nr:hypothetical protein [Austropuccinia psidii MF-1]
MTFWPFLAFLSLWGPTVRGRYAMGCGPYAAVRGPYSAGDQGAQKWPNLRIHHTWPGPTDGVQDHQDPGLPKVAGEALGDEFSPKGV